MTTTLEQAPARSRWAAFLSRTPASAGRARKPWSPAVKAVVAVLVLVALAWTLIPIYWMLMTSFKSTAEVALSHPTYFPKHLTGANYKYLFSGPFPFGDFLVNSVVTSAITAVVTVIVAGLAGYSFSRGRYLLRGGLTYGVLATQMLPLAVLVVPLYLQFLNLHLLNSYLGLIIGYCSFSLPFGAWLIKGFVDGIPIEIENAARADGASRLFVFWRIVLPLVVPGLATTAVFVFMNTWNNLLFPLVLITAIKRQTLPPGILASFTGTFNTNWAGMMAAAVVTTVPLAVAFFAVQRFLVRGLTSGAITGV